MTRDEALQEIGVAPDSSPEEIRRAYSRRTRAWNPAADPDGLRRLREAHDLLLASSHQEPPPLPRHATPSTAPAFQPAVPFFEPPMPQEPWTSRAPAPVPESSGRRWLVLLGGGLVVFLALWFWLVSFQKANAPSTEPQVVHPYVKPPTAGYESARQGMDELCSVRRRDDRFCDTVEAILKATQQHKCSDAKYLRSRLGGVFRKQGLFIEPGLASKLEDLGTKVDEEIARCWKFWNP